MLNLQSMDGHRLETPNAQVLEKPFLDFSLDVVPCRRHSPAPQRHDPRNEILQALDAHEPGPKGGPLAMVSTDV